MRPARRVGMKMRSFQLSEDEDDDEASPSRGFDSSEAIVLFNKRENESSLCFGQLLLQRMLEMILQTQAVDIAVLVMVQLFRAGFYSGFSKYCGF
jgi:hypothetical protein